MVVGEPVTPGTGVTTDTGMSLTAGTAQGVTTSALFTAQTKLSYALLLQGFILLLPH